MRTDKKALLAALVLLFLGSSSALLAIVRLYHAQALVNHTYLVEVTLGDFESALAEVGRDRIAYIESGSEEALTKLDAAAHHTQDVLTQIRQLVADNPAELALCDRLDLNLANRIALSRQAVEVERQGRSSPAIQMDLTTQIAGAALETAGISSEMRQNEDRLLDRRTTLSGTLFAATILLVSGLFVAAAVMFWMHYFLLRREIAERRAAEEGMRRLSGELLRAQDEERRHFARELHDGLGQNIVAAKMLAEAMESRHAQEARFRELSALLVDSLSQTRTMAHLLHPPLLDEIGLVATIRWLVEGYTQRTGIQVALHLPENDSRLPAPVELAVFRIVQEALTNIFKHAKSGQAEISLDIGSSKVVLLVKDFGKGMPVAAAASNSPFGVGLASMRARTHELGGTFEMQSGADGTRVEARIPFVDEGQPTIPHLSAPGEKTVLKA